MNRTIIIKECYHTCPFFAYCSDGMFCSHPYWDDKGDWSEFIINQDNCRGRVPDECPLKIESAHLEYILEEKYYGIRKNG